MTLPLLRSLVVSISLLLVLIVSPGGVNGVVITKFTNQTLWNAAIPGGAPTWCVTFNSLTVDSRITTTARTFTDTTNTSRLILATAGSTIPNDIDSVPFRFAGAIDNTTYAALWVDRDSNTTVLMSFTNSPRIRAWSAFFRGIGTAEALQMNIRSIVPNSTNITSLTEDVPNGFFGFTIDEDVQTIRFVAKNPNGNPGNGELFSMDTVCASLNSTAGPTPPTPTPPTPTPPTPTPPAPTPLPPDTCIVTVPIPFLETIICFIAGFFTSIF